MEVLVFKGGICHRKCWFPDYRFSEGIDFTSRTSCFQLTRKHLESICLHLKTNTGLLAHKVSLRPYDSKMSSLVTKRLLSFGELIIPGMRIQQRLSAGSPIS